MNAHVERMIAERKDLSDRLGRLNVFLSDADDDKLVHLTNNQVALMIAQSHMMQGYLEILNMRIDNDTNTKGS
jgi:hypothetical protein